jgi:hypothetical protein
MPSFIVSFLLIVSLVQETGKRSPHGDPESDHRAPEAAAENARDRYGYNHLRESQHQVGYSHENVIDYAPIEAAQHAYDAADGACLIISELVAYGSFCTSAPENTAISTSTAAHAAAAITRFLSFAFFFIA